MERMKLLVAYDGSQGGDAAIEDLSRAGLPDDVEATVLSVAHGRIPTPAAASATAADVGDEGDSGAARTELAVHRAQAVAAEGARRIQARHPGWLLHSEACGGSPASAVVLKCDAWCPDLVVVGSRGRLLPVKRMLGSVARKVVTEARCPVRVARAPLSAPDDPVRMLVAFDGTPGAVAALRSALLREWPDGSEIRLFAVEDVSVYTVFAPEWSAPVWPPIEGPLDRDLLRDSLAQASGDVQRAGLAVSSTVEPGRPVHEILHEAHIWRADCIFVGATGRDRIERFLLGSVSAAVADRARCTVEVVRPRERVQPCRCEADLPR